MDDLLSMQPLQPSQALVVDVAFPCTLVSPTFGVSQPYIADSPAKAAYVDAVEAELGSVDDGLRVRPVAALRLSGGASLMSADKVCHLVRRLRRGLAVEPRAQVAVDVEPLTVGTPSLTNWTSCGVNRVNLAVWSAVDSELVALGVPHRREEVQDALLFLEKFHLGNVNVRLLFGLPGQTPRSWEESLRTFAAVDCPHIEIRPLVEPVAEKASRLPDRPARRALYLQACEVLGGRGYVEYLPGSLCAPTRRTPATALRWRRLPVPTCWPWVPGRATAGTVFCTRTTPTSTATCATRSISRSSCAIPGARAPARGRYGARWVCSMPGIRLRVTTCSRSTTMARAMPGVRQVENCILPCRRGSTNRWLWGC